VSDILQPRDHYKPFQYPWAFDMYKLSERMHWSADDAKLDRDVRDWNFKLSEPEKHFLTQIFRFFTQGDVDVAAGYYEKFIPLFPKPELRMMMGSFAAREGVHVEAYSLLIDTLGLPETEYKAFAKYDEIAAKHKYLDSFNPQDWTAEFSSAKDDFFNTFDKRELARTLAVYPAFTEGLQLFSSFVMLLNFQRPEGGGVMNGMCEIVDWSIKDETVHVEGMLKVFEAFISENQEIWTDDFRGELYQIARDMVSLEDRFIDLAFATGGVRGITPEEVKDYIRFIADRRLLQLGLKPNWGIKESSMPWVDEIINSVVHANFFESKSAEYAKLALSGSWGNDIWGYNLSKEAS